ncbi:MAG: hypothetical protein JNM90_06165 [Burkholderiales bacterium]|nr:hypothetical protein [Burkholderiales bacterium]
MRPIAAAGAGLALLLAVLAGAPAAAQPRGSPEEAADERLRRVLAAVAGRPLQAVPFIERRVSALAAAPLESRGTLTFQAGQIEKLTVSPVRERLAINAERVTIDAGDGRPPTVIRLESHGALAGYGEGLRALLAGNEKLLRQAFEVRFSGTFEHWKVQLLPKDAALRRGVRQITASGSGAQLRVIETSETGGDTLELTIIPR